MKENTDSVNQTNQIGRKSTKYLENTKGKRRYKDAVQ